MGSQEEKVSINSRALRVTGFRLALLFVVAYALPAFSQTELNESWGVKRLVEFHQAIHPHIGVQDVYKLLYQACFGVEHILSDSSEVTAYLTNELASVDSAQSRESLLERISSENDYVRVNLRPFKRLNLDPALLVKAMFRSARETIPDTLTFYRLWNEFSGLVRFGLLKFPSADLKAWSEKIDMGMIEAVHHSTDYVAANRPAYRVVRRSVFDEVFGRK